MAYKWGDALPGPGDPITWPPYTGNPNDPRAGDSDDEPEDYDPDRARDDWLCDEAWNREQDKLDRSYE